MSATIQPRSERREEGFTLIELMVVVLIIAILLAIAIPTFIGARDKANDRAAQASLRNALTAAKVIYTDEQSYVSATATSLKTTDPSLDYEAAGTASSDFKTVSGDGSLGTTWFGAAWAKSRKCFQIKDVAGPAGPVGTTYRVHSDRATCTGANARSNSGTFTANAW